MTAPLDSRTFVAGLVAEMQALFARLGEQGALEAESQGRVEIVTLLRLALKSELEAAELAGYWLPTAPEIDVKMAFARQCGDEMKHYHLISTRLAELGAEATDAMAEGYSPLYQYLKGLRTSVERVAAGPFALLPLLDSPDVEPHKQRFMDSPLALEPLFSALAPARIVSERYGTRCSSVLLWGAAVRFAERAFDAGGAEQETLH